MKIVIKQTFALLLMLLISSCKYSERPNKQDIKYVVIDTTTYITLINAYTEYYKNSEALLDSIFYNYDDDVLETHQGDLYLNAKIKLDSITTFGKR